MPSFRPFANEADALALGGLTVENRVDRVSLYGSLDITRDEAGYALAQRMKQLLDDVVSALANESSLPQKVGLAPIETGRNPLD